MASRLNPRQRTGQAEHGGDLVDHQLGGVVGVQVDGELIDLLGLKSPCLSITKDLIKQGIAHGSELNNPWTSGLVIIR